MRNVFLPTFKGFLCCPQGVGCVSGSKKNTALIKLLKSVDVCVWKEKKNRGMEDKEGRGEFLMGKHSSMLFITSVFSQKLRWQRRISRKTSEDIYTQYIWRDTERRDKVEKRQNLILAVF